MTVKKVAHEIKRGLIKVRIVAKGRRGESTSYVVSIFRLYRDGEVWRESKRFGSTDIPVIRQALDAAYSWILNGSQRDGNGPKSPK